MIEHHPSGTVANNPVFSEVNNSIDYRKPSILNNAIFAQFISDLYFTSRPSHIYSPNASTYKIQTMNKINTLITKILKKEISITIESDGDGFIAKTSNLPLFGFGDFPNEAVDNLKHEIESCYNDLLEDDNFSKEWLGYKSYLIKIVE